MTCTNENIGTRIRNGDIDYDTTDVTATDIRALFGTLLLMSLAKMPRLDQYWDKTLGWDPVRSRWSRKRFRCIFRSLSVTATAPDINPTDRLAAVKHFVDELNKRFAAALIPGQWICIDETMIEFRGDHESIQFLPKKPIPIGFKCFTCSNSFGYVLCQLLYEGKTGDSSKDDGLTERIVLELMERYGNVAAVNATSNAKAAAAVVGPYRTVVMDSYYTGVPLFKKLFDDCTLAVGTLHPNRALYPKDLNDVELTSYVTNHRTVTSLPLHCTNSISTSISTSIHSPSHPSPSHPSVSSIPLLLSLQ